MEGSKATLVNLVDLDVEFLSINVLECIRAQLFDLADKSRQAFIGQAADLLCECNFLLKGNLISVGLLL